MSLFITGLLIGITSLIPGISGGTIILLSKNKNTIYNAINNYKDNILTIIKLITGLSIGALLFSKIIEYLFTNYQVETLTLFSGFLIFSTIPFLYQEKKNIKSIPLFLGILTILIMNSCTTIESLTIIPNLTIPFILLFSISGFIDGFFTIIPGISGSMIMMIIGPYYIYKSLLANLSLTTFIYLVPITLYLLFDLIGAYYGSKTSSYLLNKYQKLFTSYIIGLIISSIIILLPLEIFTSINTILRSIMILITSYIIIEFTK